MIEKKEVDAIMAKYGHDFALFSEQATRKEYKTVLHYVAQQANKKQRRVAGLE
ncbi:hypothetical protein Q7Q91_15220 [Lactiplantibacillus pentosus]|uniref:hypothetical protein n=1 Tax=Lactiplantibacillus pentosus TaxID=1589 RepID=UPI0026F83C04|nr:hypothetical protein [Lactiplantibacillus pentosus]MDO7806340.1 hypothetical protein [Lactiplantibacillus pentosus]